MSVLPPTTPTSPPFVPTSRAATPIGHVAASKRAQSTPKAIAQLVAELVAFAGFAFPAYAVAYMIAVGIDLGLGGWQEPTKDADYYITLWLVPALALAFVVWRVIAFIGRLRR